MYAAACWIGRTIVRQHYSFAVHGETVPSTGPLVLVGNHTNGLMDPGAMFFATSRDLRFLAKFKLFGVPVLGFLIRSARAIPVYRKKDNVDTALNEASFAAVHAALADGEAVVLFPEGESGPELKLRRLKTGAARMALGAEAERDFAAGLHVVPVGLFHTDRDRYRSRIHVWVGSSFGIAHLAELYASNPWSAAERLTDEIQAALERVTVSFERSDDRPLLELAAAVGPFEGSPPERLRPLARGLAWLRDHHPERAERLIALITSLRDGLAAAHLDPGDIERDAHLASALGRGLRGSAMLLVGAPLVVLGALGWGLPALIARLAAHYGPSPPDKFATIKILATTFLGLLWLPLAPLGVAWRFGTTAGLALFAVLLGALVWMPLLWERRRAAFADVCALVFFARRRRLRGDLVAARDALARELGVLARLRRRSLR